MLGHPCDIAVALINETVVTGLCWPDMMEQNQPKFHRALDISVSLIAVNEINYTFLHIGSNCGAHGRQVTPRATFKALLEVVMIGRGGYES